MLTHSTSAVWGCCRPLEPWHVCQALVGAFPHIPVSEPEPHGCHRVIGNQTKGPNSPSHVAIPTSTLQWGKLSPEPVSAL